MHTKRLAVGYGKENKWLSTPNPGKHERAGSIPLLLIVRDILGYADTTREAKKIIHEGMVLVDKKVRKDHKYGVGLMDVIDIPILKKHYRVLPSRKGLIFQEISEDESKIKPCRIVGKKKNKKGAIQLILHDGGTIIADKEDYGTNDTVILELPKRKHENTIKFEKGNIAFVYKGRHSGKSGKIKDVIEATTTRKSTTTIEDIHTLTGYTFVIGNDKPVIKI